MSSFEIEADRACDERRVCKGCGRPRPAPGYPTLLCREEVVGGQECEFREHPFHCSVARKIFDGRAVTEKLTVDFKFGIPNLSDPDELALAGERGVFLVGPRCPSIDEDANRLKIYVKKLSSVDGEGEGQPAPATGLAAMLLDPARGQYKYCFQDGKLWLWAIAEIHSRKFVLAAFVSVKRPYARYLTFDATPECEFSSILFPTNELCLWEDTHSDMMPLAFAHSGDRIVTVSDGRVCVWEVTRSASDSRVGFAAKLFESRPLSDGYGRVIPISVRECPNGWVSVKVELFTPDRSATVCYFFSPDLADCRGGVAGIYPSSEVRHVPPCTAGEPGCFVFDSGSAFGAEPRIGLGEMRQILEIGDDQEEDAVFVDTEGLLDAADADLSPPLAAKKRLLRPLLRIEDLCDAF